MRVDGAIVVARWYGGVMLGPARFAHIEAVARDAIRKAAVTAVSVPITTREDDACERRRLGRVLEERDRSVRALRGLLKEKMDGPGGAVPEAREMGYGKMGVEVLKKLEIARDGTIAWLLKEIDRVEAEARKNRNEKDFVENKGQDCGIEAERVAAKEDQEVDEGKRPKGGEEQAKPTEGQVDGKSERLEVEADSSKHASPQNRVEMTEISQARHAPEEPTAPKD